MVMHLEAAMTDMCYVASDPNQPGAAWAATVDKPEFAKDTAKTISGWVKDGAIVLRVDVPAAREMLRKWKRPSGRQKKLL